MRGCSLHQETSKACFARGLVGYEPLAGKGKNMLSKCELDLKQIRPGFYTVENSEDKEEEERTEGEEKVLAPSILGGSCSMASCTSGSIVVIAVTGVYGGSRIASSRE